MNITAIIQARTGSTRLPGKVMKMLGDKTVLGHVITRCLAIPSVNRVVVATTILEEDFVICEEADKYGVISCRGSEDHVLSRYYEAAQQVPTDVVVRITSDCPLLDPKVSEEVIKDFLNNNYDYSSSGLSGTFARGLDTEIFSFESLSRSYHEATKDYEFEHVTPYIYQHPEIFRVNAFHSKENFSKYRLTLDTPEDWELISSIYNELYQGNIFYWNDILNLLLEKPELAFLNAAVQQKKLGE